MPCFYYRFCPFFTISDFHLLNATEFIHGALVAVHTVLSQVEMGWILRDGTHISTINHSINNMWICTIPLLLQNLRRWWSSFGDLSQCHCLVRTKGPELDSSDLLAKVKPHVGLCCGPNKRLNPVTHLVYMAHCLLASEHWCNSVESPKQGSKGKKW